MDTSDLASLIELLDDNIDDLEKTLEPLLSRPLVENAGKLPLLDKAQLYVLVTYAIESILFSYLRLNGVHAKGHPLFRELTRVKQYFEKTTNAETASERITPNAQLDKAAAGRFIKQALAGNNKHDQIIARQLEERKTVLREKLVSHKAVDSQDEGLADQMKERNLATKNKAQIKEEKQKLEANSENDSSSGEKSSSLDLSNSDPVQTIADTKMIAAFERSVVDMPKRP